VKTLSKLVFPQAPSPIMTSFLVSRLALGPSWEEERAEERWRFASRAAADGQRALPTSGIPDHESPHHALTSRLRSANRGAYLRMTLFALGLAIVTSGEGFEGGDRWRSRDDER